MQYRARNNRETIERRETHECNYLYEAALSKMQMDGSPVSQVMKVQTITADERDYKRFRELGYQSMPVVTIYNIYGTHDEWCDLRVDKIKQYTEVLSNENSDDGNK